MLPALSNPNAPALTIMQSITATQDWLLRQAEPDRQQAPTVQPDRPADTPKVLNDFFFGSHMGVTEAMVKLMDRVIGYLKDKLELGRDGNPLDAAAGSKWRSQMLRENIGINSDEDFSIPQPGENGVTYREVARMIESRFRVGMLSTDRELAETLEETIGFDLAGMSVADLIEAFAEPGGETAKEVRDLLSEALAGQAGSKAMQRLEDAAAPAKTVEETKADEKKSPVDVVDEETKAEDRQDLEDAKAREKLADIEETQEKIAELVKAADVSGSDAVAPAGLALDVVQALATGADRAAADEASAADDEEATTTDPSSDNASPASDDDEARSAVAADAAPLRDIASLIIQAYREMLEDEARREGRPVTNWPNL